ncbi:MAG TPA: methylenetetrahydrofolate--tRNA-(uracil(54)-C(5))-methyltransferase (FADH(2)-oxidizing) TrmFO [Fimbriimonas sp.]|nr:methylenetetrahydrofolate--tRNA-(uracil(54)-C(5))-methyltransferase (FADH(2)-oxidizing) TrmFO [Fimbriimonas sp.]
MKGSEEIVVVGGGFAGVEAAWAAAERGVRVSLYEMRPTTMTPAHTTEYLAELVCSNSLKSKLPTSPAGRLKEEMRALNSLILRIAHLHEVPAGEALGVDREAFGKAVTEAIANHPRIELRREELKPDQISGFLTQGKIVVLATGPLTSPEVSQWLARITGRDHLYFYDAVSPTVDAASVDRTIAFSQSRYGKGEGDDYLNCPFDKERYLAFVHALVSAERAPIHAFEAGGRRDAKGEIEDAFLEKIKYFAGCTPIEAIAEAGERSLAFGNFKPVGLTDPRTGRRPYAALQLRPENKEKSLYSLVACQTRLKWGEQKRVFRMAPGLENAEFVRFGVIHRNTYLEAPTVLTADLEMRDVPNLFVAGQLTGVEGYVESAAMGIYAGLVASRRLQGLETPAPPRACAFGSLLSHLQDQTPREFAPMNVNWGLFPEPLEDFKDKGKRREAKMINAILSFAGWLSSTSG